MGDAILSAGPLGFPWPTRDPFITCVYHVDGYPAGNDQLGPVGSLEGRDLGQDFEGRDGWRMYHGRSVPGFPPHPHRGFETVTVVRRGFIDHTDSVGAAARYGQGDVQWLTAGGGVVHAEMFPLLNRDAANPLELFQIWLNLPRAKKLVEPGFDMFWRDDIPVVRATDEAGRAATVTLVAGRLGDRAAPAAPPNSWAANPDAEVAIWTIGLEANARWTLPAASAGLNRTLYFFRGASARIDGEVLTGAREVVLRSDRPVLVEAGPEPVELLLLQGRPIAEPVVAYGPFVMTTREEVRQAFADYQRTRFGGWPWPSDEPVHPRAEGRFARRPDGRIERPGS
ncbi:MAG TPA: pirin family protein [Polyangia bacterium]|nr:pirin family protein [Polyangia bacterium]